MWRCNISKNGEEQGNSGNIKQKVQKVQEVQGQFVTIMAVRNIKNGQERRQFHTSIKFIMDTMGMYANHENSG